MYPKKIYLSPSYLSRIFKNYFNDNFINYINLQKTALYARDEDYQRQKQERGLKETEWEMTKKQRQHQTRNRHEDWGMHL